MRAAAAVSRPIQPAPMTATRDAEPNAALIASLSATLRRYSTPSRSAPGTGSRLGEDPVVSSSLA